MIPIAAKTPAKKLGEKSSSEFIREKSVSDSAEENSSEKKEGNPPDELGSLSSKLLDKLAEEESKLKKTTSLEIGMWSNEMAEKAENVYEEPDEVCWHRSLLDF